MDAPSSPQTDTVHVTSPVIFCDGGAGPLGHPRIYLRIKDKQVTCPYCSKIFVLEGGAADDAH